MVQVACDTVAICKMLMHAAKHPSSTINGILLGNSDNSSVQVTDVVPLFHTTCHLAGPVEVALAQVSAVVGSDQVVGYYHSEARYSENDLPPVGRKIADKLSSKQPEAVVLVLDNKKLESFMKGEDAQPLELFTKDGTKGWKREGPGQVTAASSTWRGVQSDFNSVHKQRLHITLNDFDDHLDDISKDYLNPHLSKLGKLALPGQQM